MVIRDRDRLYAIAFVVALIVSGLLGVMWFVTNVLGWVICPCG